MKYEGLEEYAKEHSIKECAQEYNSTSFALNEGTLWLWKKRLANT